MDEIDKAFSQSSENDGGTMMRCTGSLLSWLSDNKFPVFTIGTCNNLSMLGELGLTLTRSERFDAAFFLDVPSLESRDKMLERWTGDAELASEIAQITEKFSGADLRSVVKQAQARAEHIGEELSVDLLKAEVDRKRMRAVAIYDEYQELRRWGRMYCLPAGPTDN
jgi:SpoVK/Ycf46/Vps4 family AAA+-type ATPase